MADDKPFEPTHSRLEKARREGDVARSHDICAVSAFALSVAVTAAAAAPLAGAFKIAIIAAVRRDNWKEDALHAGFLTLVPLAAAVLAAAAAAALQGGITVTWPAMKLARLAPPENIKRILSRETAFAALRSAATFLCAGFASAAAFAGVAGASMHFTGLESIAGQAWRGSLTAAGAACAAAALFAVGDYAAQIRRRRTRLRMSHDEMQRDRKEQEGDPVARGRRRTMHRQFARGSLGRVKKASFVIVNPEHVAVALEYKPPAVPVPRVLVRAADELAARVRAIAAEWGIPLVHNVAVARLLYQSSGDYIPVECYAAIASIVAALHERGDFE